MLSPFFANDKNLHLERFPHAQVTRSLQAWDATDEYFFNYLEQEALINSSTKILIFNDTFGAIAINYLANPIATVSDSYLSHQGLKHNIEINSLDAEHLAYLTSLDDLPDDVDLIIYKIPKSKALLTEQLLKIGQKYCSTVNFVAGAKAKDIHSSTLKVFEKYLGTTKTSLAVKKSRLVFCQLEQPSKDKISYSDLFPNSWPLENTNFIITNHANVFAREKLDLGARFFLEHLPDLQPNQEVIDLGCGNGVVGLTALTQEPQISLRFIDESYMAVASAQQNIESNLPYTNQCQYMVDDCLTKIDNNSIDVILCNPPFHQLQATTDHIAWQMFNDAYRVLKKGGELRIIGNRNLAYHVKLQRIFGNAQTISSNKKFVVLSAIKNN